ncbi:hypothetical protein CBF36_08825 [Vagococcus bubulae]|uniref:Regulatory protein YycH domain-containing protein n=2 Tax=Vagococcus bubulae TaxID=1977868 RepID=A0A429ZFG7_9ENTE|nr:hypothetical protein CBF36_08825 [Vagococcus bubulae]
MGMSKMGENILKIGVICMVLLSLFLSWKIWTKPANRGFQDRTAKVKAVVQKKDMTEVYMPTKLFYHHGTGDHFLYTNKESTMTSLHEKIVSLEFDTSRTMTTAQVESLTTQRDLFNLVYPSAIPASLFINMNNLSITLPRDSKNLMFNWLIMSLDDNKLYFVNYQNKSGVEIEVKGNIASITSILDAESNNYVNAFLPTDNVAGIYYLADSAKLKTYSYIIATQSFTTFSRGFFNQPNDLFSNEGENLSLSNSEGESLTIDSQTGEVNYFGKLKQNHSGSENSLYYDTFQYVEDMGTSLGNLRYFSDTSNEVVYRNYVEGFPVFGENMKGSLATTVQNKNVFIKANQDTLQIPLPSDDSVTLVPTQELVDSLKNQGVDMSKIMDIQIGYRWEQNKETQQAIDLVPSWYIKYDNMWMTQEKLEKTLTKGGQT